jgi:glycosyltransferase involved in cell wall biosynthesis
MPQPDENRVRVARIIDRLNVGGPAKHVVWLTAGLDRARFETTLIVGRVAPGEGDMGYFASAAGVSPLRVEDMSRELSLRDLLVVVKLFRELRRIRPAIVHTHKSKGGAVGRVAALLYKWAAPSALRLRPRPCQIVHTYHGHTFHSYFRPLKERLFLAIERALARIATDRILVISEQQRREISEDFGVGRPEQFRVIPLGIDLASVGGARGALRRELGLAEDECLVGIVGRLTEVKNHEMFLQAAARIADRAAPRPPVRFAIIGDGHLRASLEASAGRLEIARLVRFTGFLEDATEVYPDLDIVALTSLNEGTPVTLIEAMACGRPVAATEVGGVIDILGERRERLDGFSVWDHGVTAARGDVDGFAEATRYLIARPELRRAMGERGRRFVVERLSKDRLIRDVEALYENLLPDRPPPP